MPAGVAPSATCSTPIEDTSRYAAHAGPLGRVGEQHRRRRGRRCPCGRRRCPGRRRRRRPPHRHPTTHRRRPRPPRRPRGRARGLHAVGGEVGRVAGIADDADDGVAAAGQQAAEAAGDCPWAPAMTMRMAGPYPGRPSATCRARAGRRGCRSRATAAACPGRRRAASGRTTGREGAAQHVGPLPPATAARSARCARRPAGTGPAAVVHDEDAVARRRARSSPIAAGQERQVAGQHATTSVVDAGEAGPQRRDRAAAGWLLADQDDVVRHRLGRAHDDPRARHRHRGQHGGQHRAAADLQLRLGLAAQPSRPAAGQHDGGVRRLRVHGRERRLGVGTVAFVGRVTSRTPVLRIRGEHRTTRPDTVAAEEPLEIRLGGTPLAVTMRTPGHDFDLVHGFLATEGVITGPDDVAGLRYCDSRRRRRAQHLQRRRRRPGARGAEAPTPRWSATSTPRARAASAARPASTRSAPRRAYDVAGDGVRAAARGAAGLPDRLRAAQQVFDKTGGLHAAGLFTADGELVGAARGRRPAQRRRQGDRRRRPRGPAAAGRARADGERAGELRADPEGGHGRHPGAGGGVGAVVPGGGAGRARSGSPWSASSAATAATSTRAPERIELHCSRVRRRGRRDDRRIGEDPEALLVLARRQAGPPRASTARSAASTSSTQMSTCSCCG